LNFICQTSVSFGKICALSKCSVFPKENFWSSCLNYLRKIHFVFRIERIEEFKEETKTEKSKRGLSAGQKKLRKRHEKSVIILILIVAVFVVCHSFRLGVQTYQVKLLKNSSQFNTKKSQFLNNSLAQFPCTQLVSELMNLWLAQIFQSFFHP